MCIINVDLIFFFSFRLFFCRTTCIVPVRYIATVDAGSLGNQPVAL